MSKHRKDTRYSPCEETARWLADLAISVAAEHHGTDRAVHAEDVAYSMIAAIETGWRALEMKR